MRHDRRRDYSDIGDLAKTLNDHGRRTFLVTAALGMYSVLYGFRPQNDSPLIRVFHRPTRFSRRFGDFTANIGGIVAPRADYVQYRLNQGPWREIKGDKLRVPPPLFIVELSPEELRKGPNELEIKAIAYGKRPEITALQFQYDPSFPTLPTRVDWETADLDVQDGYWETIFADGGWRVRPKPGFEGYDRLLAVTGAFASGRRIETDLIFRRNVGKGRYGFGVLPLWGGRPDQAGVSPRRGWQFGLAWYYSFYRGIGLEFSYKHGNAPPKWVMMYRDFKLLPGRRYHLTVESWPEQDATGNHLCYRQRMKWHAEDTPPSKEWLELADIEESLLPPGEYAVALIAHRSSVDFGPVVVTPLS